MRFDTLSQIEARFRLDNTALLSKFSLPVPNEDLSLNGLAYTPKTTDYFYPTEHSKQRIVLHFTAGNLRSDVQSLTQQSRHVSVPFVIARDGTIYQLFPSKFWSGHLGEGVGNKKGTGNPQDKATIGIELSNYGFLVPKDGNLETIYSRIKDPNTGNVSAPDPYCSLDSKLAYAKIDHPFREQSFYPSYTAEQIDSLIVLLRFLTTRYNIPREFLPEDKRYTTFGELVNFKGIVSHINYRSSGKWDIGPAFDWKAVIEGVTAQKYISTNPSTKDIEISIEKEEEIDALYPQNRDLSEPEEETTDNEGYNPNDFEEKSVTDKTVPQKPELFALLVGINDYAGVRKLGGCINDVNAVEHYLQTGTDFKVHIEKLTDSAATRKAIADAFKDHLGKAKENDTIFFYYSGHGTQEEADALWDETDGGLECMVCYDGGTTKYSEFLLTDKELRFLIHTLYQKTKAHIVTVFDCCHSGDNTRNGALMMAGNHGNKINERRITDLERGARFFPKREWNEFLFSENIKEDDIKGKKVAEFLPQGTHIQMAACESNQTALEIAGAGVFTKTLIKTLTDCGSNISYNNLRSRIRQYMRASYEQTPRVYAPFIADKLLANGFLNRIIDPQKTICEATFNVANGWQLNVGALHGVKSDSEIKLSNANQPQVVFKAKVQENGVFIDYTQIEADGLDKNTIYKAEVAGLLLQEIKLELKNRDATPEEAAALIDELQKNASGGFSFGGESAGKEKEDSKVPEIADYTLHLNSGEAYITLPNDPFRPLIRPIPFIGENKTREITESIQHISRWHFIKNLQNERIPEGFPATPLKIELTQITANGSAGVIDISSGTATLKYEKIGNEWQGKVQLKITNTTAQNLYICAAYLGKAFNCFLEFLPQRVHLLEAGTSICLSPDGTDRINLEPGTVEREYNWEKTLESIKFIISTTEFVAEALTLEELPPPLTSDRLKGFVTRGLVTKKSIQFSGWITQTLNLVFINPVFNHIPADTLKTLLDWEETAFFASGLYCDIKTDQFGQPTIWKLKKGIVVPEDEKGLIDDIKLFLGNKIETAQRNKRYNNLKKDPNRLRLVAEGDSWFQYPILLQDTIDQLYKRYAIKSFAEAGDTLSNYLKKKEYLNAIGTEEARFFLVSGGGNDVLGEEFQTFLRDSPDTADNTPKRYLNQNFFKQLDTLDRLYTEMFSELIARYPDLHILVHCYDYVLPIDTSLPANHGKSSWSGKYMIEKGITPQLERENLIVYILDQFAQRLVTLAGKTEFRKNITFIDTRRLVKRDKWFDEIHPVDEGFELVAARFISEINKIKIQVSA
ncbi:caspase family protein [Dyadobacter sp. CY356]|uniref:caspase family protein n=1 Tax=Dyadobacter sp. CY356 TaxID=2906442 RepID=UPI001F198B5D|nr:caspase family protein [Dyadobacter sp. CY356]MCF0054785.1 caspase family protein [Dyadobacter sp. CY356]